MRRPRFRGTPSMRSSRFSTPEYMPSIPQSPTRMSLRSRDTGFPESFCGSRNTTLPHPEANLSPGACITEEDVNPARALIRYRMSFMAQQELQAGSPTLRERLLSGASEDGALSAFSRLAINSLRAADIPGLDALLSSKDADSIESTDGMGSGSPDSPVQQGNEFNHVGADPRDRARDPRERRRGSSFVKRLLHR